MVDRMSEHDTKAERDEAMLEFLAERQNVMCHHGKRILQEFLISAEGVIRLRDGRAMKIWSLQIHADGTICLPSEI